MSNSYCQLRPTVNHFIKQVVRGMGYIYTQTNCMNSIKKIPNRLLISFKARVDQVVFTRYSSYKIGQLSECSARPIFPLNIFYWTVPFLMQVDSSLKDLFSEISPEKFLEFLANLNINPLAVFCH